MSTFHLRVIASNSVFYDGDCEQIVIPAIDGEMGILAHHERMVVAMTVGDMRFLVPEKDWQHAVVGIGFVNIEDNEVTVLADTVERPEDIDVRRAEAARERAEEQLRQKRSLWEYNMSKASLSRAFARLKETSRYGGAISPNIRPKQR